MPIESEPAIVLRLTEYSETSQIVTLLTERSGLVRLIAKGARRSTKARFATGLDLLEYGLAGLIPARGEAGLGTLTDWAQRDTFLGLRRQLLPLYCGLYAAELVTAASQEYDRHPNLFAALHALLRGLATESLTPEDPPRLLAVFQAALLAEIGYAPRLEACVECGRAPGASPYFSSRAGGVLCRDCEVHHVEKRRVPTGVSGPDPRSGAARAWFELLDYHLAHIVGRALRSAAQLRAALRSATGT